MQSRLKNITNKFRLEDINELEDTLGSENWSQRSEVGISTSNQGVFLNLEHPKNPAFIPSGYIKKISRSSYDKQFEEYHLE